MIEPVLCTGKYSYGNQDNIGQDYVLMCLVVCRCIVLACVCCVCVCVVYVCACACMCMCCVCVCGHIVINCNLHNNYNVYIDDGYKYVCT